MEIHEFEIAVLKKVLEKSDKRLCAEHPDMDSFSYSVGCLDTVTAACEVLREELSKSR